MARTDDYTKKVDKNIGKQIYNLRLGMGLSRRQVSEKIGVTHQQLRKYEEGTDRITVARMLLIAKAFNEKTSYFLENLELNEEINESTQHQRMCLEVSRNFMNITNADHQNAVNVLVKSLTNK